MNTPTISVVIPSYNSGPLVEQAVLSVLSQTATAAEVIVVDDGSTDDTGVRVGRFAGRVRLVRQENRGVAAARNRGVALARGEYVAFLDADDVWHPRKLEFQIAALAAAPGLGLLSTNTYDWPAPAHPEASGPIPARIRRVSWRQLVVKNHLTTSSVLVRRAVLDRVGPFDTRMQGPEDHDLWIRIAEHAPVANLNLPLTGYRAVAGSLSRQAGRMREGIDLILRKLDDRGAWGGDVLLRSRAFSHAHYNCAYMYADAGDPATALRSLVRSLARHPLPYRRGEVRMPLARLRMLATLLRRAMRSRATATGQIAGEPATRTEEMLWIS